MKKWKTLSICLLMVGTGSAFAQGWVPTFNYYPVEGEPERPPLGCPCVGGTAFGPEVSIGLFRDENNNGPDPSDLQPERGGGPGQVEPGNTVTMNGANQGLGAGYFVAEFALAMNQIPEANWHYFLQISSGGCCVRTDTFSAHSGPEDIIFRGDQWHCAGEACGGGSPPSPAFNVVASDNDRCLRVNVTWSHTGNNVSGFNIKADSVNALTVGSVVRDQDVDWPYELPSVWSVEAFNAFGSTPSADSNSGATYLMRYSSATRNALAGLISNGVPFDVQFDMPAEPAACPAGWWLTLWYNTNSQPWQRWGVVADSTLSDEGTVIWPTESLLNCRLVLKDSSFDQPVAVFYDTSGLFQLVLAAGERGSVSPTTYGLAQNFPNPFNPTTRIDFSVPNEAAVSLQVFNVQGQLVRTLVESRMGAGLHSIEWDGLSNGGSAVGTGLYFYRLVANEFVATQKMLLMR
jgi:hypothetical protein